MARTIRTVTVLGANGTMGSLSGGLFAMYDLPARFLSRSQQKSERGLVKAIKQARSEQIAELIAVGDYSNLAEDIASADWIFEAVGEEMSLKREYYELVDKYRKPDAIVSTVSSGLSMASLCEGRSDSFQKHFLGTHFYNPPAKLPACEIIPGPKTDPEVMQFMAELLDKRLRRTVIPTLDTPAFAGNRIGFQLLNEAAQEAEEYGVETLDYVLGPYTGRAMPPLATVDLVGLDVHKAIVDNVYALTNDERHETFKLPAYMQKLIDQGHLGRKTGDVGGLFNSNGEVYDPSSGHYRKFRHLEEGFVIAANKAVRLGYYRQAFEGLAETKGRLADLTRKLVLGYVNYSCARVGEVTPLKDGLKGIDAVMSTGFSWAPPSLLIDLFGGPVATLKLVEKARLPPAAYLGTLAMETPAGKLLYPSHHAGKFLMAG